MKVKTSPQVHEPIAVDQDTQIDKHFTNVYDDINYKAKQGDAWRTHNSLDPSIPVSLSYLDGQLDVYVSNILN